MPCARATCRAALALTAGLLLAAGANAQDWHAISRDLDVDLDSVEASMLEASILVRWLDADSGRTEFARARLDATACAEGRGTLRMRFVEDEDEDDADDLQAPYAAGDDSAGSRLGDFLCGWVRQAAST